MPSLSLKPYLGYIMGVDADPLAKPKLNPDGASIYNAISKEFPHDEKLGIDKPTYQSMMVRAVNAITADLHANQPDARMLNELQLIFRPSPGSAPYWEEVNALQKSNVPRMINSLLKNIGEEIPNALQDAQKLDEAPQKLNKLFDETSELLDKLNELTRFAHKQGLISDETFSDLNQTFDNASSNLSRMRTDLSNILDNKSNSVEEVQNAQGMQETPQSENAPNKSSSSEMTPKPKPSGGKSELDIDMDQDLMKNQGPDLLEGMDLGSSSTMPGAEGAGAMGPGAAGPSAAGSTAGSSMAGGGAAAGSSAAGGAAAGGASAGAVTGEPITTAALLIKAKYDEEKAEKEAQKQEQSEEVEPTHKKQSANPKPRPQGA